VECGDDAEEDDSKGGGEEEKESRTESLRVGKSERDAGGGFRYVITNILYKDQVKHIKLRGLWPLDPIFNANVEEMKVDPSLSETVAATAGSRREKRIIDRPPALDDSLSYTDDEDDEDDDYYNDDNLLNHPNHDGIAYEKDGIVFNDSLGRDDLVLNTNRISALRVEDSSDDDEEDSD
jgi:probable RNA-binding protein EIF1AD